MTPKVILVFDTSMNACSAGLYNIDTGSMITSRHQRMSRGQAERLVPLINELLQEANLNFQGIKAIGCTNGPGAFTGLRIAMATAKSLSLSLNIPAIGISTFNVISQEIVEAHSIQKPFVICLETKRKEYYSQIFSADGTALSEPADLNIEALQTYIQAALKNEPFILAGDACQRFQSEIEKYNIQSGFDSLEILHPDCHYLAHISKEKLNNTSNISKRLIDMTPHYLRNADVSFPKKQA